MAPGGEMHRLYERFGENVLRHGSHEWLPYSKNAVCRKSSNSQLFVSAAIARDVADDLAGQDQAGGAGDEGDAAGNLALA